MGTAIQAYKAKDGIEIKLSEDIVRRTLIPSGQQLDTQEIIKFMGLCKSRGLNPFAKDCYLVPYKGKDSVSRASVIVSKDFFIRLARQNQNCDGFKAGIVVVNNHGEMIRREGCLYGKKTERLVGGWAEVYDKRWTHPSVAEVALEEYDQHNTMWTQKPGTMIRKVALVQALREAYPEDFGGLYDADEMPEPDPIPVPHVEPQQGQNAAYEQPIYDTSAQEAPQTAVNTQAEQLTENAPEQPKTAPSEPQGAPLYVDDNGEIIEDVYEEDVEF